MEGWQQKNFAGDGSPITQKRSLTPGPRIGSLRAEFDPKASRDRSTTPSPTPASLRADAERKEVSLLWERLTQKNKECDTLQKQCDDSQKENQMRQKEIEAAMLRLQEASSRAEIAEKKCKRLERELGSAIGLSLSPSPRGELGRRRAYTPPHVRSVPRSPRFGQNERSGNEGFSSEQGSVEWQELQHEIAAFRNELASSRAEVEEVRTAHATEAIRVCEAEAALKSAESESTSARNESEKLRLTFGQEVEEAERLAKTFQDQLRFSEEEAATYKEQSITLDIVSQPLHEEVRASRAVLEQRDEELKSLMKLHRQAEHQLEFLRNEIARDKEQNRNSGESIQSLRQQLADCQTQSENLSFAAKAAVLQPLTDELKASQLALHQREEDFRAAQALVQPFREELGSLHTRLEQREEDCRSYREQCDNSEKCAAALHDQLSQGRTLFESLQKAHRRRGSRLQAYKQGALADRSRADKALSKLSRMRRRLSQKARDNFAEREELQEWRQELVAWWEEHTQAAASDSTPVPNNSGLETAAKRPSVATHFFIGDDESSGNDDVNVIGVESDEKWDCLDDRAESKEFTYAKSPSQTQSQARSPVQMQHQSVSVSVPAVGEIDPSLLPNCSKSSRRIARGKSGGSALGSIFKRLQSSNAR